MHLTSCSGKLAAVTNPNNDEQYIVLPGTKTVRIKQEQVIKYYLRSIVYTNELGQYAELMMQVLIDYNKVEDGDLIYPLVKETDGN